MKPSVRQFLLLALAMLFAVAAPTTSQAWSARLPANNEMKASLAIFKKAVNEHLRAYNTEVARIVKYYRMGLTTTPIEEWLNAAELLDESVQDEIDALYDDLFALYLTNPELFDEGNPGGDFARVVAFVNDLLACVDNAAREKAVVLEKIRDLPLVISILNQFLDVLRALAPPPPPAAMIPAPPKQVTVKWTASGRNTANPNNAFHFGGQGPAGATLNVKIDCGVNGVINTMVVVDSKCRWKVRRAQSPGIPPGPCVVTVTDNANPNNTANRQVTLPN